VFPGAVDAVCHPGKEADQPIHIDLYGAYVKMYTAPRFTPRMHVWVEVGVGVMKGNEVETEYANCRPMTGLLPYFEIRDVSV
jgi:hypothetical protein